MGDSWSIWRPGGVDGEWETWPSDDEAEADRFWRIVLWLLKADVSPGYEIEGCFEAGRSDLAPVGCK